VALAMRTGIPADVWRTSDERDLDTALTLAARAQMAEKNDGR
jgi:hypothetical protein